MPGDEMIVELAKYPTALLVFAIITLLIGLLMGFCVGFAFGANEALKWMKEKKRM